MVAIHFHPESDLTPDLAIAAADYQQIWDREGPRIVDRLETLTGLRFMESFIHAIVFERPSCPHPLCLRASYPKDVKLGTLIHELCHRLISGNRGRLGLPPPRDMTEETHRLIDLFLFDTWSDLYGEEFARNQVAIESERQAFYATTWTWALMMDRRERAEALRRQLGFDGANVRAPNEPA